MRWPRTPLMVIALLALGSAGANAQVEPIPEELRGPLQLAPGVTLGRLERGGPQVIHILRAAPREGANSVGVAGGGPSTLDRGALSEIVRGGRARGVVAGINGDFFNFTTGHPSGILIDEGVLVNEPEAARTSLAVTAEGLLAAVRPVFSGSWQALDAAGQPTGVAGDIDGINRPAERGRETVLYTSGLGARTPVAGSRYEATIQLEPAGPLRPNAPLIGTVVSAGPRGAHPYTPQQVVISGVGADGPGIVSGLPVGGRVLISPALTGLPADALSVIGGGPELVRDGRPIADAGEGFTDSQLTSRAPRSAVGQRADGVVLMVAAEGPAHGSSGMTTAELATVMAQLGARTAVAMDAGGSTSLSTAAGPVLPGFERRITNAVTLRHDGVSIEPLLRRRLSPNNDGVAERFAPAVSVPRAGILTVEITRRRGATRRITRRRVGPTVRRFRLDPGRLRLKDGPFRVTATLTPADGSPVRTHSREIVVDRTLGNLRSVPRRSAGPRGKVRLDIRFRLTRRARVTVSVEDARGRRIRTVVSGRRLGAGEQLIRWNRKVAGEIQTGRHRIVVEARSGLGPTGLRETIDLPAPPPPPTPVAPPTPG